MSHSMDHVIMPEMKGKSFDFYPDGDKRWERGRDNWFPPLENYHSVGKVIGPVVEYSFQVIFPLETELETIMSQI